ncbi:MAG: hypothetical protein PHP82_01515 [Candidatus ainarchaeum sp.]|nr:hypothetical protein [Candidatus ainarchaeum sp.]
MNVLIAYYHLGEITKVVDKFDSLFKKKKINCIKFQANVKQELDLKKQFKIEKKLSLLNPIPQIKNFDLIIIGTPIISFTSVPAINIFIRSLPELKNKKIVLFATGIGLSGNAIKKMSSLLSMKNANIIDFQVFSSIFEFDSKKMLEVEKFFKKFFEKIV